MTGPASARGRDMLGGPDDFCKGVRWRRELTTGARRFGPLPHTCGQAPTPAGRFVGFFAASPVVPRLLNRVTTSVSEVFP
jgi:hypothetical protein